MLGPDSAMSDDIIKFLNKIDFKYLPDGMLDYSQCWVWKGSCNKRKQYQVHRLAYQLYTGQTLAKIDVKNNTLANIAKQYNVSSMMISNIKHNNNLHYIMPKRYEGRYL